MMKRLKPYGRVRPRGATRTHLRAWLLGIRDGWQQPYELSSSTNIGHLGDWEVQESLDAGINLGQWLRAPLKHQQKEEA